MSPGQGSILSATTLLSARVRCATPARYSARVTISCRIPMLLLQGSTLLGTSHYTVRRSAVKGGQSHLLTTNHAPSAISVIRRQKFDDLPIRVLCSNCSAQT